MDRDPRPLLDARWAIHLVLTAVLVWFAVRMTWQPEETFAAGTAINLMTQEAPERVWVSGLWAAASVGLSGMVTSSRLLRLISVSVLSTTHGALAFFFLQAGANMLPGVLVIIAFQGYYLVWRCARAGI